MSGGSEEPEGPHDKQCDHCGLYYQDKGVSFQMHQTACDGSSDDVDETSTSEQSTPESTTETRTDTSETRETNDPTMGTGQTPDTSDMHALPCGHEEIDLSQYNAGDWVRCDSCEKPFRIS